MKIVAGIYGGRSLMMPKTDRTRPVTEMVRAAIFNTLGTDIEDAHVLDLFAGSGALGLEALSRGARQITFVDKASASIAAIRTNCTELAASETEIIKSDIHAYLGSQDKLFEVIFLDPPYVDMSEALIGACASHLVREGILVASHSNKTAISDTIGTLKRVKQRQYGDTMISYFRAS